MSGNTFGTLFRVTTFGESHGVGLGVTIDGCPAGLALDVEAINREMARRRPGQSRLVTQRKEADGVELLSGTFEGRTTGTPIGLVIYNQDQRSKDYSHIFDKYRPSHADYTFSAKYGHRDYRGGGRSSARETAARVAAGAVARQLLAHYGISIHGYVDQVGDIATHMEHRRSGPFADRQQRRPLSRPHHRGAHGRGDTDGPQGGRYHRRRSQVRSPRRAGGLGGARLR